MVDAIKASANLAVIKCGRVLSLYLGPDDLLINLDVTFRDDLAEGEVLMAIDRIEEEVSWTSSRRRTACSWNLKA